MKILFRHIFLLVCIISIYACSENELDTQVLPQNGCINFIARPTSLQGYDVAVVPSKSLSIIESNKITQFENKIQSAYFIIFGNDGNRIGDVVSLTVTDNIIQPYSLYHNYDKGPLTVCFIANVPEDYVKSIDHTDDFENIPLDNISYDSYQTDDKDVVIVPKIGESNCIPMFGCITQSYENGVLSGVTQDANGNYIVTVPIWRLFSRVNVNLQVKTSSSIIVNKSNFSLNNLSVNNLPTKVRLKEMTESEESSWVQTASAFHAPLILNPEIKIENGSLLSSPSFDLVCYVPEYCLKPEASKVAEVNGMSGITEKQKQKYKPNLYDLSKHPVHLNIVGKSSQPNFVDVPLEYNIFLGDNEFDSFSFYRNKIYNNNVSINGTGDAILGNDDRVEATYHNLADPTNSGTDRPANCYIIGRPGRYLIPTYRGPITDKANADYAMLDGIDISKTATHSDGKNSITNLKFTPDSAGRNWVRFDVNMTIADNAITDLPSIQDGNSVLEFKNSSGTTVWSWHLWFTSGGVLGSEWGGISSETYNTTATMMNRNLGSSGAGNNDGMYYQWGDKDPYFTPSGKTAGYYGGITAGSWTGTTKSVTDPCPPGYKIPSFLVWNSKTNAGYSLGPTYFTYEASPLVLYPYSSYLDANKVLYVVNAVPLTQNGSTKLYSASRKLGRYYIRLAYSGSKSEVLGYLWGSNGYLFYSTETFSIDDSYTIQYSTDNSAWKNMNSTIQSILNRLGLQSMVTTMLGELKEAKEYYTRREELPSELLSNGYQVRCVSETSTVK